MFVKQTFQTQLKNCSYMTCIVVIVSVLIKVINSQLEKDVVFANGIALLKQSMKWFDLSKQDGNYDISYQHANYSIAFLQAARHVTNDTILEQGSGIDVHKYFKTIDSHQRSIYKKISKQTSKLPTISKNGKLSNGWL